MRLFGRRAERDRRLEAAIERLGETEKAFTRLAREQAKANLLWEESLGTQSRAIESLGTALAQRDGAFDRIEAAAEQRGADTFARPLLPELLGLLDNLYEAALALRRAADASPELAAWADGIRQLHRRGEALLEAWQIRPLEAQGEHFDPERHRALAVVAAPGATRATVALELERGYLQGGRLLRAAGVQVAKPEEPT